jgi:hypothetical protein
MVRTGEDRENLAVLNRAFESLDIVFGVGLSGGYAQHRGLTFVIASLICEETRATVLEQDIEHKRLIAAAAATGIEERLKSQGRGWYALSPAWADADKSAVHFFLNPRDQKQFNHGWFTVGELDAWAQGSGPVVKTLPERAA